MSDYSELKRLAEAAHRAHENITPWFALGSGDVNICFGHTPNNVSPPGAYIAAAAPSVILAILAELEALRAELEQKKKYILLLRGD